MGKYLVALLLIFLVLSSGLVQAASSPVLKVWPEKGHRGSVVLVYGYGFTAHSNITLYFDTTVLATLLADEYGGFSIYVQIPLNASPGQHIIRAEDTYGLERTTYFYVTQPRISVTPNTGSIETKVHISVEDLTPYDAYIVKFDDITLHPLIISNADGELKLNASIPAASKGDHYIRIIYSPMHWGFLIEPFEVLKTEFRVTNGVATDEDIESLKNMINELNDKIRDVNETLYNLVNNIYEKLSNNITSLNDELNNLSNDLVIYVEELNTSINILEDKVQKLKTLINALAEETRVNHTVLATEITSINKSLNNAISSLNNLISSVKNELLGKINKLNTNLASNVENLLSRLQDLEKQLEDTKTQLQAMINNTSSNLDTQIRNLKNTMQQEDWKLAQQIQELQQELNKTKQELATTKQQNMILAISALITGLIAITLGAYSIKKKTK